MFEEIGSVRSEADAEALGLLALFRDSISEIRLNEPESASTYFNPKYSHYIVVHTPLSIRYPEKREEWNLRFSRDVGVSLVELVQAEESSAYVKGLMAVNGSKVYAILPYTSIDAGKAELAKFPEDRMGKVRAGILPEVLPGIRGETVLDVGCGFGGIAMEIARNNPGSKVYGIDIHDSMIAQAQMDANVQGVPNVEFRTGSAYALPFETGSIETATCFFMLHHLEDIRHALSEIKRVLKAGGELITVEPLIQHHDHGPMLSAESWKELFEEAGFETEMESKPGAVVLRALKRDL
jgi:2-polyprenyl-3-methyl-5-hydroxy-6-metoxy-1,4-benzoquinol methylase